MNRKKYLACCVVASMMLGVASPAMVSATSQDDVSVNDIVDIEDDSAFDSDTTNSDVAITEDESTVEISDADIQEDYETEIPVEQNITEDADLFSSGEDFISDAGDSDTNEGWMPLTTLMN